jgi:hypothetical protein
MQYTHFFTNHHLQSKLISFLLFFIFLGYAFFLYGFPVGAQTIPECFDGEDVISGKRTISEICVIPEGETLSVHSGTTITFDGEDLTLFVRGTLDLRGTPENPIILTAKESNDFYTIEVSGTLSARHTDFSKGGSFEPLYLVGNNGKKIRKLPFVSTAFAYSGIANRTGAVSFRKAAMIDIRDSDFHDNTVAVTCLEDMEDYDDPLTGLFSLQRSSFFDNSYEDIHCPYWSVDARYNWWGSAEGPEPGKVEGEHIETIPIRSQKVIQDPVVILPGILGSFEKNGKWQLDPIFKTYDILVEVFEKNGYDEGVNLFPIGYDWRKDNVDTATLLADKIQEIKKQTNWPWVDIVAHSMGGLVA